ncbi:Zn2Cys6 transcription factor [Fusarium pseudocircinatum]|uniref:Zn2Cys6 transcription factor n=1 Tax=Fusarium pseudocircinatum TaxID=56676 RepID=A0A8H5NWG9_9HYPO|nr:Zn2Cys6 transcription factor [Fusarium pseudocircinatum]
MSARNSQSIRSSCDRCRSHKLKCTVSPENSRSGPHKCTRCIRAQVTCVFGPRSQSKRSSHSKSKPEKLKPELEPPQKGSPSVRSSSLAGNNLGSPGAWTPWIDELSCQEIEEPLPIDVSTAGGGSSLSNGGFWADLGMSQELNMLELAPSAMPTNTHHAQYPAAFDHVTPPVTETGHLMDISESSEHTPPHAIVQLSTLVTKIHETSESLEESPWSDFPDAKQLQNYPIGRVLSLSQDFCSILSCIWGKSSISPDGRSSGSGSSPTPSAEMLDYAEVLSSIRMTQDPTTSSSMAASVDMPTTLLVLSCYTSLIKLYSLVFAHFQNHLSHLPEIPSPYPSQAALASHRWGLQLGELPPADETCTKICTAVQVLLDAFQSVEDVVGLPRSISAVRQRTCDMKGLDFSAELGRTSLWTDCMVHFVVMSNTIRADTEECEEMRELSMKVRSLKALIRKRMNL